MLLEVKLDQTILEIKLILDSHCFPGCFFSVSNGNQKVTSKPCHNVGDRGDEIKARYLDTVVETVEWGWFTRTTISNRLFFAALCWIPLWSKYNKIIHLNYYYYCLQGKSSIINRFISSCESGTPDKSHEETIALEYRFAKQGSDYQANNEEEYFDLDKISHLWELGYGLLFQKLIQFVLTKQTIRQVLNNNKKPKE